MLDEQVHEQIAQIHAALPKLVFEFAGAGSQALYWLHQVAGSSRTVLEASDRYTPTSLADLIGSTPEKFVSQPTAEAMASAAYLRAVQLAEPETPVFGLALTATIATDRVKRGDHGCWVAVRDAAGLRAYGLTLTKGARDRDGEEAVISSLVIRAIAEASGIAATLPLALLGEEQVAVAETPQPDPISLLLAGKAQSVTVAPSGERHADAPVRAAMLSGSFNPLHQGHERLAQVAAEHSGLPAVFELPILNADKPPLAPAELERRLAQFRYRYPVVLSRAPLFVQKADLFPGSVFVLGYDTAARLIEPRYYGGEAERDAALAHIQAQGCRFLVAGRVDANGAFQTLADLAIPAGFASLFRGLPESAFRLDLSSTAIRAQQQTKGNA